jgi:hypothetical protein
MPTEPSPQNRELAKKSSEQLTAAGKIERFVRSADRPQTQAAMDADNLAKKTANQPDRTLNTNQFRK